MKNILSILLLLLAFTACGDKSSLTDVLNRAEAVMNEHPDSALNLLRTLTFDDFQKEKNRARYALLHSQALDKNYIDVTSDSLISVAVDYYKDEDDVRSKFLSYYYMGRVHANGERYLQATSCLMESEQLVEEVGDDYLSGLLYSEMGRIYRLYYDYPKSLEAYQKAAEYYERAGKIGHRNYMWFNQSGVYRDLNKDDEGERMLKKVLESAIAEGDNTLIGSCKGNLVMLYIKQGRMKEARVFYEKWESIVGLQSASSSFMAELAMMYAGEGDFNQAQNLIQEGWKHVANRMDSVSLSLSSAKIYYMQGKGMLAYEEVVKGISLQNRGTRQALQQPVLTVQRDYLSEKLDFQNYKLRMEKHFRILCFLFFVVLLGIVVYVLSKKLKQEKEKARRTIDELNEEMQRKEAESHHKIASLLQELEGKHQSDIIINSLREELFRRDENLKQYICESESIRRDLQHVANENLANASQLYREKMQSMSEMVLKFEEKKDSNIIEEIRWWKNKYLVGRKAIAEMERQVNLYNEDVMLHFRKEVTMSEEKDYHWVCYLFAGVSVKAIAWLLGENKGAIYQRRFRLRSEIEASDYLHKELFLELLDK